MVQQFLGIRRGFSTGNGRSLQKPARESAGMASGMIPEAIPVVPDGAAGAAI